MAFSLLSPLAAGAIVALSLRQARTEELAQTRLSRKSAGPRRRDVDLGESRYADAERHWPGTRAARARAASSRASTSSRPGRIACTAGDVRAIIERGLVSRGRKYLVAEARDAIESALQALGVLTKDGQSTGKGWWERLPTADLTVAQRNEIELAVYQQLILLGLTPHARRGDEDYRRQGVHEQQPDDAVLTQPNPEANRGFRSAIEPFEQAQAMEMAQKIAETTTLPC